MLNPSPILKFLILEIVIHLQFLRSSSAFVEPIQNARLLFDFAREKFSCQMHLLDLGGGFPGSLDSANVFNQMATEINRSLDINFPCELFAETRIIAEPGTYFAHSAFTLCSNVIAKRETYQPNGKSPTPLLSGQNILINDSDQVLVFDSAVDSDYTRSFMYYINDGIFNSDFSFYLIEKSAEMSQSQLMLFREKRKTEREKLFKSSIWGPTCDGSDVLFKECLMPELHVGDSIVFKNMGAYTLSLARTFNGMPVGSCYYVVSTSWSKIEQVFIDSAEVKLYQDSNF